MTIIEFPSVAGAPIRFEVITAESEGVEKASIDPATGIIKVKESFEAAIDNLRPAISSIYTKLRGMTDHPDEIEIEFGLKATAGAGFIIASGSVESNITVRAKWVHAK